MRSLTSRVFTHGNGQFVRIPDEFRLAADRVRFSRNEQGELLIHPLRAGRGEALLQALHALAEVDGAFIAALEADQTGNLSVPEHAVL